MCEKFVYKHLETECFKNYIFPIFKEIYKLYKQIVWEFLGMQMQNCQGYVFIWTQTFKVH